MSGLRIAAKLTLPVDVAGEAIAILAKRGAGKTNTGRVLAEELVRAGVQTVVLDPVGAWWGLRSSADGKGEGLAVPILGGAHGDVPLEPAAGALLADVVVDSGQSIVLDLSDFSKTQQRHFVTDFAERLYVRKARARGLLHLILEEGDEFVPQRVSAGDARMVGAIEQLVRRGRSRGIGVTMISQRSASINKAVLEQADVLIALQMTGPRDRAAIEAWVSKQDVDGAEDVLPSLPGLKKGEAWVWNPERGILDRTQIRLSDTYDSGATPKAGQARAAPRAAAAIDLTALGERIQATAERAKENDPAELRKRIRQLEGDATRLMAAKEPAPPKEPEIVERFVEVSAIAATDLAPTRGELNTARRALADAETAIEAAEAQLQRLFDRLADLPAATTPVPPRPRPQIAAGSRPVSRADLAYDTHRPPPGALPTDGAEVKIGKGERTVLEVLAEYPEGRTPNELAFLAGYSAKASTMRNILASLRKAGLVDPGQPIRATAAGLELVGGARERPTGRALLDQWLRHPRMGEGERKVLLALIDAYPDDLSNDDLCNRTGYSPEASTMRNILASLRKLGLVDKGARRVAAEFYEAIAA